ncbi:MAG: GHMP kinase [Flavobacteriaceae bacterium]|nr:GHMP kinase [Flavobacteriaceae bacterium]
MNKPLTFDSNGKLLLTAEYLVLDGAKALALPSKFGQSLTVTPNNSSYIHWQSLDKTGAIWFEANFSLDTFQSKGSNKFTQRLTEIFAAIATLKPKFFSQYKGLAIETHLEFDRDWGLGSSSTLINSLATWANVDAYKLLELTFGGSGYDIACARHNTPILYQLKGQTPQIETISFNPNFKSKLHFIHLNKKQDSRDGIAHYQNQNTNKTTVIDDINAITDTIINCNALSSFEQLIDLHEAIISEIINLQPIKKRLFPDYIGSIKSLGAWGGDFILATGEKANCASYFQTKGYTTIMSFDDMIK